MSLADANRALLCGYPDVEVHCITLNSNTSMQMYLLTIHAMTPLGLLQHISRNSPVCIYLQVDDALL